MMYRDDRTRTEPGPQRQEVDMDHAAALRQTVRVGADGTVTYGITVPHEAANIRGDTRFLAAAPRHAQAGRFRGHDGVPADILIGDRKTDILAVTLPHDCANHLPDNDAPPNRIERLQAAAYVASEKVPVAA